MLRVYVALLVAGSFALSACDGGDADQKSTSNSDSQAASSDLIISQEDLNKPQAVSSDFWEKAPSFCPTQMLSVTNKSNRPLAVRLEIMDTHMPKVLGIIQPGEKLRFNAPEADERGYYFSADKTENYLSPFNVKQCAGNQPAPEAPTNGTSDPSPPFEGQQAEATTPDVEAGALLRACVALAVDRGGLVPVVGATLADILRPTIRNAQTSWETANEGYILRVTKSDQLTGNKSDLGIEVSVRDKPMTAVQYCGPTVVNIKRGVLNGRELSAAEIGLMLYAPFSSTARFREIEAQNRAASGR